MSATEPICVLNFCTRPQGRGTYVNVRAGRDGRSPHPLPVCEKHWEALRTVLPDDGDGGPS